VFMGKTEIVRILIDAFERGNFVYICGNGGSASMAQHFATEFMGKFEHTRKALPAIALTTDTSFLTAYSNDYPDGFERVFSRQLEALGRKGDVLITLSTSGKSKNCLLATQEAKKKGMIVIDFPREHGTTALIQEDQLCLMHDVARSVELHFYENNQ
jgi:D-sedoheptulose 7-phosphate isomerase